jgi:hypothetical protein
MREYTEGGGILVLQEFIGTFLLSFKHWEDWADLPGCHSYTSIYCTFAASISSPAAAKRQNVHVENMFKRRFAGHNLTDQ